MPLASPKCPKDPEQGWACKCSSGSHIYRPREKKTQKTEEGHTNRNQTGTDICRCSGDPDVIWDLPASQGVDNICSKCTSPRPVEFQSFLQDFCKRPAHVYSHVLLSQWYYPLSTVFVQHHINLGTKFSPFMGKKKNKLDTPQMRLVDFDENVGGHRDGVPPLYNRQPGNLHCTFLPSSALVSHPCRMVSFIGPNIAPSLTVTTLTYSWFLCLPSPFSVLSSFLSLPSLQSQKQSPFLISCKEAGGGIFMHPLLLLHQTLTSKEGTSFPQRNSSSKH